MPSRFELGAQARALAAVEGAVAAARFAAGHRLELGERAHARSRRGRIVEAALAVRIGDGARLGRGDQHEIAFAHAGEQLDTRRQFDMRTQPCETGRPSRLFVVGAVDIDVARERVAARPAIDAILEPVEGEDAGQDQILLARLAAPHLAGRLARDEHGAGRRAPRRSAR